MSKERILGVREKVEEVMNRDERARDSDWWLIILTLREYGARVYFPYDRLDTLPSGESITRARRYLNSKGRLLPSAKVQASREAQEELMRLHHRPQHEKIEV